MGKNKKKLLCFGELLIDFLNNGRRDEGGLEINEFHQYPGGAPANVAVAVAKLGGEVSFVGQVGNDRFGHYLRDCLKQFGVNIDKCLIHPEANTPLAYVFLDDSGDRSFEFLRNNSADLLFEPNQLQQEWFEDCGFFHFCSNTLTHEGIYQTTKTALAKATKAEAMISFDVNLRHNLWAAGQADAQAVKELLPLSDIIKFSREELEYIYPNNAEQELQKLLQGKALLIFVTDGGGDIEVYFCEQKFTLPVAAVEVVDTTAAGDAFCGALLAELMCLDKNLSELSAGELKHIAQFAIKCGSLTTQRPGAFPALPTRDELNKIALSPKF